jgi:starch phosphorylase
LERKVVPAFYADRYVGVPTKWLTMVRHTMGMLGPQVQATRMVREYVRNLYAPAAASATAVAADDFHGARDLAAYRQRLRSHWTKVRVVDFELASADSIAPELGASVRARATPSGCSPNTTCSPPRPNWAAWSWLADQRWCRPPTGWFRFFRIDSRGRTNRGGRRL